MDKALRANIEALIKSKRGFEFEATIKEIHLIMYGSDGYQPTRERHDGGAEGLILSTKTITAAYGPDAYDEKKFLTKVNGDFDAYLDNWAIENKNWVMYYNNALAPEQIKISEKLKDKANKKGINVDSITIKGIDQILQMIQEKFSNKQIRQLADYLGVSKELITFDNLRLLIDDLIRGVGINPKNIEYNLEVDIEEKIELNYNTEDVESANQEYEELAVSGTLKKIFATFSSYQSEELTTLKFKIITDFNRQNGSFKEKLNSLTDLYYEKYSSGEDHEFYLYVRGILVYCFEQCIIGKKTKDEKKGGI